MGKLAAIIEEGIRRELRKTHPEDRENHRSKQDNDKELYEIVWKIALPRVI